MDLLLMFIVVVSASFSVYYSFKSRAYRREGRFEMTKFYQAKTNIAMGMLLVGMGIIQTFTFPHPSLIRVTIGLIFLALGLFNFYMGTKHYRYYLPQVRDKH